jgi:hypothetical protein
MSSIALHLFFSLLLVLLLLFRSTNGHPSRRNVHPFILIVAAVEKHIPISPWFGLSL